MKRFIVATLLMALLLTACTTPGSSEMIIVDPQATEEQSVMDYYEEYLKQQEDKVLSSLKLPSGGILIVQELGDGTGKGNLDSRDAFTGENLNYSLARIDAWQINGKLKLDTTVIPWAEEVDEVDLDPVWIFYGENEIDSVPLQEILDYPSEHLDAFDNYTDYYSHYFFLDGRFGRDVVIIVIPPMMVTLPSYSDCPQYGIEPYDNLDSVPMKVLDKTSAGKYIDLWNCGYPIWIFVIPEQRIDDNYELHYGDLVLTGKDIQSGIWSSDGVLPPSHEYGGSYIAR